jgi:hypothetical protein
VPQIRYPPSGHSFWPHLNPLTDPQLHIYQASGSPYPSPLQGEPSTFGKGSDQIRLLDQFGGRRPWLLNRDFLTSSGDYPLHLLVTLVLDSNVVSRLHNYRTGSDIGAPGTRAACEDLLLFASRRLVDYNPTFYLLESCSKSTPQNFIDYVSPVLASILYLHSMDEAHFIATREIKPKPEAVYHYCALYGERTLEECGRAWAERALRGQKSRDVSRMVRTTYIALMKMTLIHKQSRRSVYDKMEEFHDFLTTELGIYLAYESHLAVYYFADLVRRLLSVQPQTSFEKARKYLRRTAWDILLLRLPEMLLSPAELPIMNLPFICSGEQELTELGAFFTIESIAVRADDHAIIGPLLSMDLSLLEKKLGSEAVQALIDRAQHHLRHRATSTPDVEPPCAERLERLEATVEAQLADFLSGASGRF